MDKAIVVTVPHNLGVDAAKRRVAEGIARARTDYLDKLAHCDLSWSGNKADLRVSALGQTVAAQIDVQNDSLRIEVRALGILSGLLNRIGDRLIGSVKGALQIEHAPPKS
jgi:Putative polyhydroxyalkanoic acid system protein (PHA_gran_rgn)